MSDNISGAHPPGRVLGSRFRVEKTLGRGGFAITYLCRAGEYNKAFAVKEFLPITLAARGNDGAVHPLSEDEKEMFDRGLADFIEEGRRLLKCRHPNVVEVEDFFEEYGTAYLVMECVEGQTLSQRVGKDGTLTAAQLVAVLLPTLDALKVVHGSDLLHRDLTPNNIMLRGGDLGQPVLIDFGAARHSNAIRSYSIAQVCSDGYSPPEQYDFRGKQGPYSDIYALGCIAYRCLTGQRTPFAVERLSQDALVGWADRFPKLEGKLLAPVISKSIAVDPAERQQSAEELRREIEAVRNVWSELERLKASELTRGVAWNERADGTLELSGIVGSDEIARTVVAALRAVSPNLEIDAGKLMVTTGANDATRMAKTEPLQGLNGAEPAARRTNAPQGATRPMPGYEPGSTIPLSGLGAAAQNFTSALFRDQRMPPQMALWGVAAVVVAATALFYAMWTNASVPSKSIKPNKIEQKQTTKVVTPPETPFEVQIDLPRSRFRVGDSFSFAVQSNRDCYFLVYTVSAADKVELHDPRVSGAFMGDPLLKAGERREIPVATSPGRARINPPVGTYQIGAVCGREDLEKLGIGEVQLRRPAQEGKRSFTFTMGQLLSTIRREELARVTVNYEVE